VFPWSKRRTGKGYPPRISKSFGSRYCPQGWLAPALLKNFSAILHERGVPGTFFQLLECVDADIYLFCDQDDIWQRGRIDATVAHLLPDLASPVLCSSDPLMFYDVKTDVV